MKHISFKNNFYLLTMLFLSLLIASCNSNPNDEDILKDVNDSLQAGKNTQTVNAAVKNGTVTLNGTCEGDDCVAEIEDKIRNVDGVKTIQNNVSMAPQDTDLTLRTQVQSIIINYSGVQAEVANGIVVLRGTIDRGQLQPLLSELNDVNVLKIDNQLVVR